MNAEETTTVAASSYPELLELLPRARSAPLSGRRLYLHERSLNHLASCSRRAAHEAYTALAQVSVLKTIYHQVRHDGVYLSLISEGNAENVLEHLRANWSSRISAWFHRVALSTRSSLPVPLLAAHESVVACCYFAGYYTFATGYGAAERMFRDQTGIAELRRRLELRREHSDLSLITGRLLPSDEISAYEQIQPSDSHRRQKQQLSVAQATAVRMEVLAAIRGEIVALASEIGLPARESAFLRDRVDRALEVAFSRGILKTL